MIAATASRPFDWFPFSFMAIEERWARAIDTANASFEHEQQMLAERFDLNLVAMTILRYRCIAELTVIAAAPLPPDY